MYLTAEQIEYLDKLHSGHNLSITPDCIKFTIERKQSDLYKDLYKVFPKHMITTELAGFRQDYASMFTAPPDSYTGKVEEYKENDALLFSITMPSSHLRHG